MSVPEITFNEISWTPSPLDSEVSDTGITITEVPPTPGFNPDADLDSEPSPPTLSEVNEELYTLVCSMIQRNLPVSTVAKWVDEVVKAGGDALYKTRFEEVLGGFRGNEEKHEKENPRCWLCTGDAAAKTFGEDEKLKEHYKQVHIGMK